MLDLDLSTLVSKRQKLVEKITRIHQTPPIAVKRQQLNHLHETVILKEQRLEALQQEVDNLRKQYGCIEQTNPEVIKIDYLDQLQLDLTDLEKTLNEKIKELETSGATLG